MELNKAVLDCMQALRRRLRDELSVDIRLSQTNALETMLLACLRSNDPQTRELGVRLAELSDLPPATPAHSQQSVLAPRASVFESQPEATRTGSVRMYRGQRVYA